MSLNLESLNSAIKSLDESIHLINDIEQIKNLTKQQVKLMKAGVIQNFEFTYELAWKFIKRWLEENYCSHVDGVARNELFRIASEHQLILNVKKWFDYHKARNQTSHLYDEILAEEVFLVVCGFIEDAKFLLSRLESNND